MFNPVLRRYTPPTCSLEISANRSPLSRWTDRPVLKQVRFQLSFDDPRLPVEQQVTIRGDRAQLESLCEVVSLYVQQLLEPESLQRDEFHLCPDHSLGMAATAVEEAATGGNSGLTSVESVTRSHPSLNGRSETCSVSDRKTGIILQPRGLVAHELRLGVLTNEESGDRIDLSALQLFDLANALDDYTAEALALPTLQRPTWLRTQPVWMQVAAVLVLAVGITTPVLKVAFNDDPAPTEVASEAARVESTPAPAAPIENQQRANRRQNLPSPPAGTTSPASPLPTIAAVPTPAAPTAAAPPAPAIPAQPTPVGQAGARNTAPLPQVAIAPTPANPPAGAPPTLQLPTAPIAPPAPVASGNPAASAPESATVPFTTSSVPADAPDAALVPPTAARSRVAPSSTAFDAIPQVAEARTYVQERWIVPEGLTQTLEYQLVVGADGTVEQIIPLGQASRTYVDRTELPLIGEPFVSPLETGQTARLRLVLTPEGKVQTFLEDLN